jgi:hypothetical protein
MKEIGIILIGISICISAILAILQGIAVTITKSTAKWTRVATIAKLMAPILALGFLLAILGALKPLN